MPFQKGKSGNPGGRSREKPFHDALRMELAAAGTDHKALRTIARNLITIAQGSDSQALSAIREIADRIDGKPLQALAHAGADGEEPVTQVTRVIVGLD